MNDIVKAKTVILTGPVHTGTSTALLKWAAKKHICGFLNPVVDGKKVLLDAKTGETFIYERSEKDSGTINVGPYYLCSEAFKKAAQIFEEALKDPAEWLVMDEIGKLELSEQGHHLIVVNALLHWKNKLLLVVRDSLLPDVINKYNIQNPQIIHKNELIKFK